MSIFKIESGLIFDDQFENLNPRWQQTPYESITVQNKQMVLNHSNVETRALFELPSENELVFQVNADYFPVEYGDEGGIVVWQSALNKLEFLESKAVSNNSEYSVWRAVKKSNLWSFYAQRNGNWDLIDSAVMVDPSYMGITLKGIPDPKFKPLNARRAILCKNTYITVGNIDSGYRVELVNNSGTTVTSQIVPDSFSGIQIELPSIPFNGRIKIYDAPTVGFPNGVVISEQPQVVDLYGGDIFLNGTDLQIIWNGEELDTNGVTNLGKMRDNMIETKMEVYNASPNGKIAESIEVAIKQYHSEFGWQWVDVATDVSESPGTYQDSVNLGNLMPGEAVSFWVKVQRNTSDWSTKPTHFIFDISHL